MAFVGIGFKQKYNAFMHNLFNTLPTSRDNCGLRC